MKNNKKEGLMKSCHTVTELISLSQEQPLTRTETLQLRFHTMMCSACRNFDKNTQQLSNMMKAHKAQTKNQSK